ncbi:ABC transporter substrate-binding protein [Nocardia sp. NPDC003979]
MGRILAAAVALAAAMVVASCADSEQQMAHGDCASDELIIGSADFPESETVATIYTEVLRINGFKVATKFDFGNREAYLPAVRRCVISLVPEYTGNLLRYLNKDATATTPAEVDTALSSALGEDLAIATPAPGQNSDAVVVTRATAQRWNLTTIADLAPHSAETTFAAKPEFADRPGGLPGLRKNYGLDISAQNFVAIADEPETVRALTDGRVTAADIYTTSPAIIQNDLVVLTDPKNNFAAQNVVPLFHAAKKTDKAVAVLDAVSAELTTAELISLNTAVSGAAKIEPKAAALAWLTARGLDTPIA